MNLEQTDHVVDVDRPDGERVRLRFHGEAARQPDVVAGLVELLLASTDGNFYDAVSAYVDRQRLDATFFLGTEWVTIEVFEPLTLNPLVNASGGSPRASANRQAGIAVSRRLRAPVG